MSTTSVPLPAWRRSADGSAPGCRALLIDGTADELFQLPDPAGPLSLDGSDLIGCVLEDGPGSDLVRSFLGGRVHRWMTWRDLRVAPPGDRPEQLIVSAEAWRRHGAIIWSELAARRMYIALQPEAEWGRVVVAVQRSADAGALLRQARRPGWKAPTIVHASWPSSTLAAAAALGGLSGAYYPLGDDFASRLRDRVDVDGSTPTCTAEGPASRVVREAAIRLEADLLVMGWHHHRLPWPKLVHPTAWHLSRSVPMNVLLIALDGGEQA